MPLSVAVPALTQQSSPVSVAYPIVQGHLKSFRIKIPSGHYGRTGLRITYQGTQIFPWALTGFYVGDGETFNVAWEDEIMATGLRVQAFNTDRTAHTFYLLAEVWPAVGPAAAAVGGLDAAAGSHASALARVARLKRERRPAHRDSPAARGA